MNPESSDLTKELSPVTFTPELIVPAIVTLLVVIALFGQNLQPSSVRIFGARLASWLLRNYIFFLVFFGHLFYSDSVFLCA